MESTTSGIAVIICAYTDQRWQQLVDAIESVQMQTLPANEIVVVIDHNPTLLARVQSRFPTISVVENSQAKGLSGARNSGIAATKAELIGFVDDDAVVEKDWLKNLRQLIYADSQVMGAGGRIIPKWEGTPPKWLPQEFYWVVGCTHKGLPETTSEVRNLIGANMLVRRAAFDKVGGFLNGIGRVDTIPLGCEETEFCIRTRQAIPDAKFVYDPNTVVEHNVPVQRTGWSYFRDRCYAEGLSKALVSKLVGQQDGLSAERTHVFKTLPAGFFKGLANALTGDWHGLQRTAAIFAGLFLTTLGYIKGRTSKSAVLSDQVSVAYTKDSHKLRILMVSARFAPYVGGTETHVNEVAKRMAAEGHDVTVLTTDPSRKLPRYEEQGGFKVRRVAAFPSNRDYYFAPGLYPVITQGKWDIIHLQGYHTLVAPLTMFAALVARIHFVVSFHSGGHSSQMRNSGRGIQRFLLKPLLKQAKRLIGVAQFEADFFSKRLGIDRSRFVVVPNGSQLPKLTSPVEPTPYSLIVSPGRLERYKGHQTAIQALPKVLRENPNVRLRIVGTGPYEAELRELARSLGVNDRVEIGGIPPENRQGMAALMSQAALVVLFSEYEAHPVAVMEALSLGRTVLVADTSGLSEIAKKGWVKAVPLDSTSDEVAAAILRQLNAPPLQHEVMLPTWDDCATSLLAIYQTVLVPEGQITLAVIAH
ncbi:MAG: glycosyltransferase [Anaerolineaceae bacterium]|nr:glycosyltransferase [Anaerolineaceae bacterium]